MPSLGHVGFWGDSRLLKTIGEPYCNYMTFFKFGGMPLWISKIVATLYRSIH